VITLLKLRPYTGDKVAPSPNHGGHRAPMIQGIVLHATADEGDEALSLSWMRSPKSHVSCHLLVGRSGRVTRLVGDQKRAWHAGVAWWRGTSDVNAITLGIEIANRNDGEPFTRAQYRRVADIVAHYCRQGLSLDDVVSHGEIASGRKTDPLGWDWDHFRSMVQYRLRPAPAPPPRAAPTHAVEAGDEGLADLTTTELPMVASAEQRAPVVAMPKRALYSRTLWINGMTVLAAGGMLASQTLELANTVGITVPEVLTKWALFGVGLVNIVLRLRTTQPLTCNQGVGNTPAQTAALRTRARSLAQRETRPQRGGLVASAVQSNRAVRGTRAV
jgi:N-acetylmuramoyl-L-alanine amidase